MYLACRECDTISCFRPASTIVDLAAPRTHCCFHNGTISTIIDIGEYRLRSRTKKPQNRTILLVLMWNHFPTKLRNRTSHLGPILSPLQEWFVPQVFSSADSNMNPPLLNPFSLTLWHCGFPRLDKGCLWWRYYMNYSMRSCMQQRFDSVRLLMQGMLIKMFGIIYNEEPHLHILCSHHPETAHQKQVGIRKPGPWMYPAHMKGNIGLRYTCSIDSVCKV